MRLPALLASLLAVATLGGVALGQPMIDPREMSGIPRPDPAVPARTLTVRVLHGDFGKPAAIGHPVHLVQIAADGTITRITQAIREDGRVEFTGLEPSGKIAYHALTLLGGDRLQSQPISMPPMLGVRSMLVGRKLDAQGQPIGAPADDLVEEGTRLPAAGTVEIGVRGVDTDQTVELLEVPEVGQAAPAPRTAKTKLIPGTGELIAGFADLPGGPDKVYVARLKSGERTFASSPFMLSPTAGARGTIFAVPQLLFGFHMGGELDDEFMRFEVRYSIGNLSGVPWDPGPKGLLMPLPEGALGGRLVEETLAQTVRLIPEGAVWNGVIPPGQRDLTLQFSLPVDKGGVKVVLPAPLGVFQSQVFLEKLPGSTLTAPPGISPRVKRLDGGREFDVIAPIQIRPGGKLEFRIDGLPEPPIVQRALLASVSLLVLAMLVLAAWLAIRPPPAVPVPATRAIELGAWLIAVLGARFLKVSVRQDSLEIAFWVILAAVVLRLVLFVFESRARAAEAAGRPAPDVLLARKDELRARREALYEELVQVERARTEGAIDDEAAAQQRDTLVARLTAVLHELDRLEAPRAG